VINWHILPVQFVGDTAVSVAGKLFDNGFNPGDEFLIISWIAL
jgi:hypothetical protein